jgi:hypothetical protein
MNPRICKIAQDTDAWCDKYYFGDDLYDLEWEQKFAELIVRECVGVNYKSPFRDGEFHAREVLEHFGVKE